MASKMLQFIETDRDMPTKRGADDRREDFLEIYGDYIDAKAKAVSYTHLTLPTTPYV